nr:HAD family phosphatase [uncultured Terrisporobacter sp.]
MFNFKGAIFDLDGTIIDSMGIWEKIDIKFFEEINIPMPLDYIKIINNMSFEESAIYTIKRFNLKESKENLIERWNQMAMFEYAHNIKLKPNVRTYLEKLKENNIKIGLATASPQELYESVLKNNKIYDYFDAFTTLQEVKKDKNYPDIYLLTSEKLGICPEECAVFEDILIGINTCKKANFKTVGVYDKYAVNDLEKIKNSCNRFIYDFKELL